MSKSLHWFYSDAEKAEYEKCQMYDISKLGKISGDFATALANRPDNLQKIACSGPEGARYAYDTTEGLDTIVNQVST